MLLHIDIHVYIHRYVYIDIILISPYWAIYERARAAAAIHLLYGARTATSSPRLHLSLSRVFPSSLFSTGIYTLFAGLLDAFLPLLYADAVIAYTPSDIDSVYGHAACLCASFLWCLCAADIYIFHIDYYFFAFVVFAADARYIDIHFCWYMLLMPHWLNIDTLIERRLLSR